MYRTGPARVSYAAGRLPLLASLSLSSSVALPLPLLHSLSPSLSCPLSFPLSPSPTVPSLFSEFSQSYVKICMWLTFFWFVRLSHTHSHIELYIWCVYGRYRYWHLYISSMCNKYLSGQIRWPSSTISFFLPRFALSIMLPLALSLPLSASASFLFHYADVVSMKCANTLQKSHVSIRESMFLMIHSSCIYPIPSFCIGYLNILLFY